MSQIICHHNGRYNIYSTISDGFYWVSSISIDQLKDFIEDQHGGIEELENRLARANRNGHSAMSGETLDEFLCCNRAGEKEAFLTTDECIERFLSSPHNNHAERE